MPKNAIHIESGILTTLEEYKLEEAAGSPACARPTRAHSKLPADEDKKSRHGHAAKDVGARRSFNEYRRIE